MNNIKSATADAKLVLKVKVAKTVVKVVKLTAVIKIWQSVVAFKTVNDVYESGVILSNADKIMKSYEGYQVTQSSVSLISFNICILIYCICYCPRLK